MTGPEEIPEGVPVPGDPRHAVRLARDLVPYVFCAGRLAGRLVLELGCGPGFGTRHLAGTCREVHAYDHRPDVVAWARVHQPAPNVSFRLEGTDPDPEPSAYGGVCSFGLLDRVRRPRGHLRRLAGFLATGGRVYLAVRNRLVSPAGALETGRGLTPEELADHLLPLFADVRLLGIRGNAKVQTYRRGQLRARRSLPPLHRLRLSSVLPRRFGERLDREADALVRREVREAGGPSPLAIDPDDFDVGEADLDAAERLLAICAREPRDPEVEQDG